MPDPFQFLNIDALPPGAGSPILPQVLCGDKPSILAYRRQQKQSGAISAVHNYGTEIEPHPYLLKQPSGIPEGHVHSL